MDFNIYDKDYLNRLKTYLRLFGKNYPDRAVEYILKKYACFDGIMDDMMFQIYAYLGMLDKEENFYYNFAEMILEKYGNDISVLEIGGGYLPMFAKELRDIKDKNKYSGKIGVYEPNLVISSMNGVELFKEEFKSNINVLEYDLLVGILPCEATRTIIRSAIRNDKQFLIGMCGCTHFDDFEIFMKEKRKENIDYEAWFDCVYSLALNQQLKGYEVKKENISFLYPYQVISSKKLIKK